MKKYFAIAGIFVLCFTAFCSKAQKCCTETNDAINQYCQLDRSQIWQADIRIDSFNVTKDSSGHLLLSVQIRNTGNQDARDAGLIILLPVDICNAKVTSKPSTAFFKQLGGRIEFCFGSIPKALGKNIRTVIIQTDTAYLATKKGTESFAGFVFSSTPDQCPINNYSAWVNQMVLCRDSIPFVKKGSIH